MLSHIAWLAALAMPCDTPKAYAIDKVVGTSPWEPSNTQKETSPLAHYVRNSLPHKSHRFCSPMRKNWSQQLKTSKWEPFFPPPLAHFIHNSLPRCAPQCSSGPILPFFGFQKLYTIYGAKPIYALENLDSFAHSLRSLHSLSKFFTHLGAYAWTANPIPCSSSYSFASLALTSSALPDSPAPRREPYIGIRFLLFVACKRTLVP